VTASRHRFGVPKLDVPVRVESRIFSDYGADNYRSGRWVVKGTTRSQVPSQKLPLVALPAECYWHLFVHKGNHQ